MNLPEVQMSQDVVAACRKVDGDTYQGISCMLSDDGSTIVVEKTFAAGTPYDEFLKSARTDACRFLVFLFKYEDRASNTREGAVLILWAPEAAKARDKIAYSMATNTLMQATALHLEVHGRELQDISLDQILEYLSEVK